LWRSRNRQTVLGANEALCLRWSSSLSSTKVISTSASIAPRIRAVSDRRESALGDLDSQDVSNGRVSLMHRFAGTACLALILLIYESV
jgi:hypothetical protein